MSDPSAWTCPVPPPTGDLVRLAHGGGGTLTRELIDGVFLPALGGLGTPLHDGATLDLPPGRVAFTTDSFVVQPLFFPGGDIGSLAVHGTVNDLAMCGARPLFLAAAFVLEESLPIDVLRRVVASMGRAAAAAGVRVVTGDTKVVERGKGDGVVITTTGIGVVQGGVDISPARIRAGDLVLVSGEIGAHGIAVLSARHGLGFDEVESDAASLHGLCAAALDAAGRDVHVLRDPTRGGLAGALHELAAAAGLGIELDEEAIPVGEAVRGASELLGLDPLYVANEGKCVAIVERGAAASVLGAWRVNPYGKNAAIIGKVGELAGGGLVLRTRVGARRIVVAPGGEQLPRIC